MAYYEIDGSVSGKGNISSDITKVETFTYDNAPYPDKVMFFYGVGGASKRLVGVKISVKDSEELIASGFVRNQGPSLTFD